MRFDAQLAALSERLRTATVAGETEQLRELLPQASGEVNALILAAQAAAQRRAVAARYVPAPNVGTGGMDLASVGGMDLGTADLPREISSRPQTFLRRVARILSSAVKQGRQILGSLTQAVHTMRKIITETIKALTRSTHSASRISQSHAPIVQQILTSDPSLSPQLGTPVLVTEGFTLYTGGYYNYGTLCVDDGRRLGFLKASRVCVDVFVPPLQDGNSQLIAPSDGTLLRRQGYLRWDCLPLTRPNLLMTSQCNENYPWATYFLTKPVPIQPSAFSNSQIRQWVQESIQNMWGTLSSSGIFFPAFVSPENISFLNQRQINDFQNDVYNTNLAAEHLDHSEETTDNFGQSDPPAGKQEAIQIGIDGTTWTLFATSYYGMNEFQDSASQHNGHLYIGFRIQRIPTDEALSHNASESEEGMLYQDGDFFYRVVIYSWNYSTFVPFKRGAPPVELMATSYVSADPTHFLTPIRIEQITSYCPLPPTSNSYPE